MKKEAVVHTICMKKGSGCSHNLYEKEAVFFTQPV
jgi:hypothetical protein